MKNISLDPFRMDVRRFARRFAYLATTIASAFCSSGKDATGPSAPVSVTLSESPATLTNAGVITLVAAPTGGTVQRVEFYGRHVNVDTLVRFATITTPPFQSQRQMQVDDNGNWEFLAKAYESDGSTVTSNTVTATVSIVDTRPLSATFTQSHDRITTPGKISFTVSANKPLSRIEVDRGDTKVAEALNQPSSAVVDVSVTAADNGTQSYVVKAVDATGNVASSAPLTVAIDIRWDLFKNVADIANGFGFQMVRDPSGALYIAIGTLSNDIALVKSDEAGNQLWTRTFGGPDNENVGSVAVDPSGRVYVIGGVLHLNQPSHRADCVLLVYDADGTPVRTQLITAPNAVLGSTCVGAVDRTGNVYVAATLSDGSTNSLDIFLGKYDTNGAEIWTKQFGSAPGAANDDILTSIAYDPINDGVYVAGYTSGSFDGAPLRGDVRDIFVLKYDAGGNRVWTTQYGIPGILSFGTALTADPNGGVYVEGSTRDNNDPFGPPTDLLVLRLNADGAVAWAKRLDSGGYDYGSAGVADARAVYIVGYIDRGDIQHDFTEARPSTGSAFLARISVDGTLQFIRMLSPAILSAAVETTAGDIIVGGHVAGPVSIARHHDPAP
jgi:hypothetical protein